jgi:flagellar protein FlaG
MARIDAAVATQIGDLTRPYQTARESDAQVAEARRVQVADPEAKGLIKEPSPDDLDAAIKGMQQILETATGRQLNFALNDRFKELIVRISDRKSGEVIKEFPSKEFMQLRERLNDLIGLFIDEKA